MAALCALFKTTAALALPVDIGSISELNGSARVIRGDPVPAGLQLPIQQYDDVRTSNGRLAITFLDDSLVRLTEHSSLVVDEYVFDANPDKAKLALKFASGTARFVTGKLGAINRRNISLKTPSADIAIRGTSFSATVDELGRSLIILLPKADGSSSGEIVVSTMAGEVVLSRPFESTTVDVYESAPARPVVVDLTLDLIDNMLIVTPPVPDEESVSEDEEGVSDAGYLEFSDLDIDFLEEDFLDDSSELEFTELDINYLDVNFLEDLLDIIDELDSGEDADELAMLATSIDIQGTQVGQDAVTQIATIIDGQSVSLRREVGSSVRLDLDGAAAYTVILIQDGVSRTVKINGGSNSKVVVRQTQ